METVRIYHNPRCSTSRATLTLLRNQGIEPEIVKYLESPPTVAELTAILDHLGLEPLDIMRQKEPRFAELGLGEGQHSREELIAAMVENPVLMERPIVVRGDRAALGRPPEAVLNLLD